MKKIGIITDTNSGMSVELAAEKDILLIPMPVIVNGHEYFENVNLSQEDFFAHMVSGTDVSTSQPAPAAVMSCWNEALQTYDELIYIPMSSALSGSCESAKIFAREYNGKVHVIDNRRISVSQKQSALDAAHWRELGYSAQQISKLLMDSALNASIYLAVDDLKYLKKGGRITPSVATIGTVLNIKPVLKIQGGKLDAYKKVRGMQSAKLALVEAIQNDLGNRFKGIPVKLWAAYSGNAEMGKTWFEYARNKFPDYQIHCDALPISIVCHAGPGAVGLGITQEVE